MVAYQDDFVRIALPYVLGHALFYDLSLLEVDLDRLAGHDALDELLTVGAVDEARRHIGVEVNTANGASSRCCCQVVVDDGRVMSVKRSDTAD